MNHTTQIRALLITYIMASFAGHATSLQAQSVSHACGDQSYAREDLARHFQIFTSIRDSTVRGTELVRLPATADHYVVTDPKTCRRVLRAVTAKFRHGSDGKDDNQVDDSARDQRGHDRDAANDAHGRVGHDGRSKRPYTFTIFRYGPYYAVQIVDTPPPGIQIDDGSSLVIFRADTLAYVTAIAL